MKLSQKTFLTIKTEGSILPADLLQKIAGNHPDVPGLRPSDYGLFAGEKINEAVNRSWNRIITAWNKFKFQKDNLPQNDPGTTITRNFMLLILDELDYHKPVYQNKPFEIEGKYYPISHFTQNSPLHIVGCKVDLDKRTAGIKGAAHSSPHSMVQEFLNRCKSYLWGFVGNGLKLRILRDNITLTRQAYVEFDIESMMEGEVYSDFTLLWLLCHNSRVEAEKPEQCFLEKWFQFSATEGVRALEGLRGGVEKAVSALGAGFLSHPANKQLKNKLRSGDLSPQDYYRQILRLVYRLIFLFVAEDRRLLLDPAASKETTERYYKYYSTQRIRKMAERLRGTAHGDIYQGLVFVMNKLASDSGCPQLALPALGSFLWTDRAVADLVPCHISNRSFLDAIRPLAFTLEGKVRRIIDYKNMGAEELGSVYESLLELHPEINADAGTFELKTAGGNERKTTGSYYTPSSLINCLLDSALDPVLDEAAKKENPEKAILELKVCDPACGSGHFLIAAAHRIAKKLASVRTGDEEPSPEAVRHALRDVIGRCIYGVDINPMSVELCKVSLWMEALEPGKPLSFLDHHIKCGNSLIGATPALIEKGIPDEAFNPVKGDDKKFASDYKKQNQKEKKSYGAKFYKGYKYNGQSEMFDQRDKEFQINLGNLPQTYAQIDEIDDGSIEGVHEREDFYEKVVKSTGYLFGRLLADAWCAAFMWKKASSDDLPFPITEEIFRRIERNPHTCPLWMKEEILRLANRYQFFHWHLEFPDVFNPQRHKIINKNSKTNSENTNTDGSLGFGGFDAVIGNPPWERIKLQEKEWFAVRCPDITAAPNAAARKKMIKSLKEKDPLLYKDYLEDLRKAEGESLFIRASGRYPLCGRGDINTYSIFTELNRSLINLQGRVGCIVPSGIATDDTTKFFFQDLVKTKTLYSLFDFENRKKLFPAVDSRMKFCLITMLGYAATAMTANLAFFLHEVEDLNDENKVFTLSAEDIEMLNPNTKTCPIFRSKKDAQLTKSIYKRVPVLIKEHYDDYGKKIGEENPWGIKFSTMFHMSNDSHLFRTKEQMKNDGCKLEGNIFVKENKKYLPLYEAKMIHHFDHRWAAFDQSDVRDITIKEKQNPNFTAIPRYWLNEIDLFNCINHKWDKEWLIGFRNITNTTNERTIISGIINKVPVGHSCPVIFLSNKNAKFALLLTSLLSSFIVDYCARQKLGGTNLTYGYFNQFPVLSADKFTEKSFLDNKSFNLDNKLSNMGWFLPRGLELTYTAWDLEPFAKDCGYHGPPFRWNDERRFLIRCELDAAYFHLYQIQRDDVDYIMETFPIVKRKDEAKYDEFYAKIPFAKEACENYELKKNPVTPNSPSVIPHSPCEIPYCKYATKAVILEIYDRMKQSMETGIPYKTILNPPPADTSCAHQPKTC